MSIQKILDRVGIFTSPLDEKFKVYAAIGNQSGNSFLADYKKDVTQDVIHSILSFLENGKYSLPISGDKGTEGELRFIPINKLEDYRPTTKVE